MTFNPTAITCEGLMPSSMNVIRDNRTEQHNDSFTAYGQAVLVAWESSDLDSFTPASAPLIRAVTSNLTSITSSTATSAAPSDTTSLDETPPNGLTAGARAGIGVGVACGIGLACVVLGFVLYKRRRRTREDAVTELPATQAPSERKAELGSDGHIEEIDGLGIIPEADHANARYELEGNWQGYETSGAKSPT